MKTHSFNLYITLIEENNSNVGKLLLRAEKQRRVDVCVGFLNDNQNKAEEMRQVNAA